jgi:uncharacterized protein
MIALRLVVDTNIMVSAALKPNGLQRTVLLLAITKPARLYVTEEIIAEYRDVLSRADAAGADYLVTGNQRHFPKFWKKTTVITSREFIDVVAPHLVR